MSNSTTDHKWHTNSNEYCEYCGAELLEKDGKTKRYSESGEQYSPYTHYKCPNFSFLTVLFKGHEWCIKITRRPR